ncbi:MAG: hypothetical protein CW716_01100 [Candidatus Bathyarchaeum sp.]|nr:MAG: hypothetical protein CW716_01100 [Candidatus Bathyarchaeum sp.]
MRVKVLAVPHPMIVAVTLSHITMLDAPDVSMLRRRLFASPQLSMPLTQQSNRSEFFLEWDETL